MSDVTAMMIQKDDSETRNTSHVAFILCIGFYNDYSGPACTKTGDISMNIYSET